MSEIHPVDALKALGAEISPEQEARMRHILDEVVPAVRMGNPLRHTVTGHVAGCICEECNRPRVITCVLTDGISTKDGCA